MPEAEIKKPAQEIKGKAEQAAKAETTSQPKREYRTLAFQVALLSAVGAFAVLTYMVKMTPLFTLDIQITKDLQSIGSPVFAGLMSLVSWFGFPPQSYALAAVIVLFLYLFGLHWEAVTGVVAALLPPIVNVVVKDLIRRPRPTVDVVHVLRILDSYSFPSGHVMFYVGFFGFLWFLVFTILKRSWIRTTLLVGLGSLIALVGPSRIYLGQHWGSDVLGAYLLGSLTLAAILWFYRWGKKRFFVHQPVAPQQPARTSG